MTEKKLPTGVGKKIVEALKKQNEFDLELENAQEVEEEETMTVSTDEEETLNAVEDNDLEAYEELLTDEVNDVQFDEEPQETEQVEEDEQEVVQPDITESFESMLNQEDEVQDITQTAQQAFHQTIDTSFDVDEQNEFTMPSNVNVLRKLISQLPAGVTKQIGAQIIRQTMEALGISMNSVLSEAQQVQDGLNDSIKDCMTTVNEYKQNIMTLEKQVVDYQKQVKSINDLISLFLLTDK